MPGVLSQAILLDAVESLSEFQSGLVQQSIRTFQLGNVLFTYPRPLQSHQVEAGRLHIETRIEKKWRSIGVDPRISADHCQTPDSGILVNHNTAGNESLIFNFDVSSHQSAAGNH